MKKNDSTFELIYPDQWKDYELIDSGEGEKLERFGKYITIRPEPQALWDKSLSEEEWNRKASVRFVPKSSSSGNWHKIDKNMPDRWNIAYQSDQLDIQFRLALTSFKHVGVFPEQAANWEYIVSAIKSMPVETPKVLNMFAYTGGASLAAKQAGADIIHLDSIKQVVSWSRDNMELSGLKDIRWMIEDAAKYAAKAARKGVKYNGIIMDPPAFGHGPKGENWKLDRDINELISNVVEMLDPDNHFLVVNTYSLGMSFRILRNIFESKGYECSEIEEGEIMLKSSKGKDLPLGIFFRTRKY